MSDQQHDDDVEEFVPSGKPPQEWVTGDEPATGPQLSYLETLGHDVGEPVPTEGLTKATASELIDELRRRSPRVEGT